MALIRPFDQSKRIKKTNQFCAVHATFYKFPEIMDLNQNLVSG